MSTIESGVITLDNGKITVRRGVRMDQVLRPKTAVKYRIVSDDQGLHMETRDGRRWAHYVYVFHYEHDGRSFSVTWRCGDAYGQPKGTDGLTSSFLDASCVDYQPFSHSWARDYGYTDDTEGYRRAMRDHAACARTSDRLTALFGDDNREKWQRAFEEMDR